MLVAQPFSPALFRQGPFEAAELFLNVLRGRIPKEKLQAEWEDLQARKSKRNNQLTSQTWPCGICKRELSWLAFAENVDANSSDEILACVIHRRVVEMLSPMLERRNGRRLDGHENICMQSVWRRASSSGV